MLTEEKNKEQFYNLSYDRIFKTVLINDDYRFLTMLLRDILEELIKLDEYSKNGDIDLDVGLESILCRYCAKN